MRLKTKLVLSATGATLAIVLVLSIAFLGELLRQRISQTAASNDVMARQVLAMTRQALETGLRSHTPMDRSPEALDAAIADALRGYGPLNDTMNALVRYSPAVQDVSVTDARGWTLISTDPQMWNQQATERLDFSRLREAGVLHQAWKMFGKPRVLDVTAPLDRNGIPILVVHVGVRSTFLRENYLPGFKDALLLVLLSGVISMVAAGLLANVALLPIAEISRRLERLTGVEVTEAEPVWPALTEGLNLRASDAVVRVTNTIDRLGQQMKTTEAGYTDLQANLNQMLDTLRDGVVLFTAEWRAVMVSDAVENFVGAEGGPLVGRGLLEIFAAETALGRAVLAAFEREENVTAERVRMEDGREVEISLTRIHDGRSNDGRSNDGRGSDGRSSDGRGNEGLITDGRGILRSTGDGRGGDGKMGTLLTLRDTGSAIKLEQELEVSRRLAAIGRLTAGVGHEVKNPINAMVVHLELLRSKLQAAGEGPASLRGAQRHVDILAGEMERLDRVVQTLADFTRPMELHLEDLELQDVARTVIELTGAEMAEQKVKVVCALDPVRVRADGEMLRQAILNLMLNGMQAMPGGGNLRVVVRREQDTAVFEIHDEGEGVAPELMPKIFDLYFTTKPKGSGIGLAMTYRIAQMHGGAMEVRSEAGRGASFMMRLPAAPLALSESRTSNRVPAGRSA